MSKSKDHPSVQSPYMRAVQDLALKRIVRTDEASMLAMAGFKTRSINLLGIEGDTLIICGTGRPCAQVAFCADSAILEAFEFLFDREFNHINYIDEGKAIKYPQSEWVHHYMREPHKVFTEGVNGNPPLPKERYASLRPKRSRF
jgi:hypothetical protein